MKKNIAESYEYDGLGFPIILENVPLIEVRGVLVPNLDYNLLQKNALLALCQKPYPLTGNEIRFIRQYLSMTYKEFASKFGITHACVIHWEKAKNLPAKITPSTELYIRLYILDFLRVKNTLFRNSFRNFHPGESYVRKAGKENRWITLDSKTLKHV